MKEHVILKRVLYILLAIIIFAGIKGISLYRKAFNANIYTGNGKDIYIYIPTGSKYDDVMKIILDKKFVKNFQSFEWTAHKKKYANHIMAGRYKVGHRMSNNDLINMLRSGRQEPVKFTFNNIRTLDEFAKRVSVQLEINSEKLLTLLNSKEIQAKYGLNKYTMICMFIPNTYEFYWNTSEEKFLDRMYNEFNSFWNNRRIRKAEQLKLTKEEVITLASIVNEETYIDSEKPRIAGVYINRLQKKIRLQADPTVIYAIGNFSIKRVLRKQYQIKSSYNTYQVDGLPPGPICIPDIASMDAVLDYEKHDYLYFCAKADFSGYHVFAKTLEQHNRNARLYRAALNKRKIYR